MANDDWVVSGGKGALDFDGVDDSVNLPDFNFGPPCTISWWELKRSTIRSGSVWLQRNTSSMGVYYEGSYFLEKGGVASINSGITVQTNRMQHLVWTVDSQNRPSFYRDGSLLFSSSNTQAFIFQGRTQQIGNLYLGGYSLNGLIDDVRLYRRDLTAGEVRLLWQIGRGNMPLRRRRRYTEQAGGNRRRRVLLTAGS